jgi:hypothetical protein
MPKWTTLPGAPGTALRAFHRAEVRMVRNATEIIVVAHRHIGLREQPLGSNDGPQLRKALAKTPFQPGQAWCYYFALACLIEAFGDVSLLPPSVLVTGSCQNAADHAREHGALVPYPAVGSIFLLHDASGHYHHAGIISGLTTPRGTRPTIEGNSNTDGSTEGYEVVAHERGMSGLSYIVW